MLKKINPAENEYRFLTKEQLRDELLGIAILWHRHPEIWYDNLNPEILEKEAKLNLALAEKDETWRDALKYL